MTNTSRRIATVTTAAVFAILFGSIGVAGAVGPALTPHTVAGAIA